MINYHFVWIPRRRRKILSGELRDRLDSLVRQKAKDIGLEVLAFEIQPDHVHLFVNAHPKIAPFQIMFNIKGYTARILREEFPVLQRMPSVWTRSYFCSTAGNVSSSTIQRYIENQKKQ